MAQVMITNGGPHSAAKWAEVTAKQIIDIGKDAVGPSAMAGRKLELDVLNILEAAHAEVQTAERAKFAKIGTALLDGVIDPGEDADLDGVVDSIVAASVGSDFEAHFAKQEVQAYLRTMIGQHFATSMYVERSWIAEENPTDPKAIAFKERNDLA